MVAVFNFFQRLADSGATIFQHRDLCFGRFVELPAVYGFAENGLDTCINDRAMARQMWPKLHNFSYSDFFPTLIALCENYRIAIFFKIPQSIAVLGVFQPRENGGILTTRF